MTSDESILEKGGTIEAAELNIRRDVHCLKTTILSNCLIRLFNGATIYLNADSLMTGCALITSPKTA